MELLVGLGRGVGVMSGLTHGEGSGEDGGSPGLERWFSRVGNRWDWEIWTNDQGRDGGECEGTVEAMGR